MKNTQLIIELRDALEPLSEDLISHIMKLMEEGCIADDIARLEHVHCSSISRKIGKIQEALKKEGF